MILSILMKVVIPLMITDLSIQLNSFSPKNLCRI